VLLVVLLIIGILMMAQSVLDVNLLVIHVKAL